MKPGDIESDFMASLHDAKTWCGQPFGGTTGFAWLRSTELAASHPGVTEPYGQSMAAVNALVVARSRLMETRNITDWPRERLHCCDFAASEASGASELASAGYFDWLDLPPWDTWVAWVTDYRPAHDHNGFILAFVPRSCISVVQLGIAANPVECVFWLDAADVFTTKRLKHVMPEWLARYAAANAP